MAATYLARLVDGPCDGTTKKLTQAQFNTRQTTCSGQTYIYTGTYVRQSGWYLFEYQAGASTGSAGAYAVPPRTHQGWNHLRHTLNTVMPTAIHHSRAGTAAALRTLSKLPKVR